MSDVNVQPPPSKRRLLFVDDEPAILQGLRRVMRPLRDEMESEFAASGSQGLALMAQAPFDVVIADMRMPGMDGAAFLTEVQRRQPHAIRIILSGHAEVESALRAVPVAHQFIAKPCEADTLRQVIARALGLQALLDDRRLQGVASGLRGLPASPKIYSDLTRRLMDPRVTSREISLLMEADMALCAKLLQVVNSAFFGLSRRVTSIETAVNFLGTSMLKAIAVACSSDNTLGQRAEQLGYDAERRQAHSLLSAQLATTLMTDKLAREDAFAAGVLQDVGELLLVAEAPDQIGPALAHAQLGNMTLHDAERELGTIPHSHVGAFLLGAWGLPYSIVEAVAHHHAPHELPHEKFDIVDAVYVGSLVAEHSVSGKPACLELARTHLTQYDKQAELDKLLAAATSAAKAARS